MTELWDKQVLIDYFPTILKEIKGNELYVDIYHPHTSRSIDIEIVEVKND